MTSRLALPLATMALLAAPALAASSPLDEVERMTATYLSQPDERALSHDGPAWRAAVESQLKTATDAALEAWRPPGLTRIDATDGGSTAWCGIWRGRGGAASRLVWIGRSTVGATREAMAFTDDIGSRDSLLTVGSLEREGLSGIAVYGGGGRPLFAVGDVKSRMALRIMTASTGRGDTEKDAAEDILIGRLGEALETLSGDLSGMPEMTVCDSPDKTLRTVTYMLSYRDFSSRCGGWVVRPGRHASAEQLTDATGRIGQPEMATLTAKSWYGALYTNIIQFRYKRKDYYALLGYKGADATTKTRVIDVVSEGDGGLLTFGASRVFIHPKQTYRRRIFQYSSRASMTMHYDERASMIVMDHLEPSSRLMVGHPEYYGPDLSYDAYLLTDDGWKFQSDIQVTVEDGAVPNEEDGETIADSYESQPGRETGTATDRWSGRSSGMSRRNRPSAGGGNSWFDKGRGNSAPNIRNRNRGRL